MPGTEHFTIGAEVSCTDGPCGRLSRVVADPVARVVTHLIVEPRRGQAPARLVPLELVDSATDEIRLNCTSAEFDRLDPAEETQFIPGGMNVSNYRPTDVVFWPYYGYRGARGDLVTSDTIPSARWRSSAANMFMPPTAILARWKGWSLTLTAIA